MSALRSDGRTLHNLQALRALAALLVILVHVNEQSRVYGAETILFSRLQNFGDAGVDLFFVISGFILVYVQRHRPTAPGPFLVARIWRVVPLYWLFTLLYVILWAAAPQLFNRAEIDGHRLWQSLAFATVHAEGRYPVLYLGWTLEYEVFFYLVFAAALLARDLRSAVAQTTIVLLIASVASPYGPIVVEFLFGAWIGLIYDRPWLRRRAGAMLLAGSVLLLATLADPAFAFAHRWLVWGVPSALLVAGAVATSQRSVRALSFLGDASYSIYLVQVFTISGYYKLAATASVDIPNDLDALFCIALTMAAGCLSHVAFERPVMRLRPRRGSRLTRLSGRVPS